MRERERHDVRRLGFSERLRETVKEEGGFGKKNVGGGKGRQRHLN